MTKNAQHSTARQPSMMSKRSVFTSVTPLPASVGRAAVLAFLHDYEAIIDVNPLVTERHRIPAPPNADPDEALRVWYSLTDAIVMPWSSGKDKRRSSSSSNNSSNSNSNSNSTTTSTPGTTVSYTCVFHPLSDGLQTHCRAPLGVDIRARWTVAGTLPDEPRQPVELGLARLGAPAVGLYLREDVDLHCSPLMAGFVKKTLRRSHAALVARLARRIAAAAETVDRRRDSGIIQNAHAAAIPPTTDSDRPDSTIPSSLRCPRLLSPAAPLPPSTAFPLPNTTTSYPSPRYVPTPQNPQQQQHRPRFPTRQRQVSLGSSPSSTAPLPGVLHAETQPRGIMAPALRSQQQPPAKQDKAAQPEYLLQPHTYDASNGQKAKNTNAMTTTTAPATIDSVRTNPGLYPEPLRVPRLPNLPQAPSQAQAPTRTQPIPKHPDYPPMNPYDDGDDSPVLGHIVEINTQHPMPVFVELAADSELQLVPVMLDTGRNNNRSRS
ncbi:hypothetical protein CMQ_4492 [Grosmannia clavigera kw1407]|uniref:DUF7053 domain-containing protein n=1 Tax=Grosmannia clavigera (strain kw1407 / UAMH 11150) TaxID=655863 RepID=F0XUU1_GROCL|nr:uncharacterized protein CMQ_4492 [Grosmannia clavigera kw1407]EFW98640.1 hypothetical protein CMQ_4492 [Grosmannia clavigera kw1407]